MAEVGTAEHALRAAVGSQAAADAGGSEASEAALAIWNLLAATLEILEGQAPVKGSSGFAGVSVTEEDPARVTLTPVAGVVTIDVGAQGKRFEVEIDGTLDLGAVTLTDADIGAELDILLTSTATTPVFGGSNHAVWDFGDDGVPSPTASKQMVIKAEVMTTSRLRAWSDGRKWDSP